tara:strand:- start:221 stop:385 length:165 start_codon:yes stop_codon:yes gene_type:complete
MDKLLLIGLGIKTESMPTTKRGAGGTDGGTAKSKNEKAPESGALRLNNGGEIGI